MPIFEFICPNGHTTEVINILKDGPGEFLCPQCGAVAEKLVSVVHVTMSDRPSKRGESAISRAIGRVKQAERDGRL